MNKRYRIKWTKPYFGAISEYWCLQKRFLLIFWNTIEYNSYREFVEEYYNKKAEPVYYD